MSRSISLLVCKKPKGLASCLSLTSFHSVLIFPLFSLFFPGSFDVATYILFTKFIAA